MLRKSPCNAKLRADNASLTFVRQRITQDSTPLSHQRIAEIGGGPECFGEMRGVPADQYLPMLVGHRMAVATPGER